MKRELFQIGLLEGMDLSLFRHISDTDLIDYIQRVGVVFYRKDHPIIETTQAQTEADPVAL